jgi:transposase
MLELDPRDARIAELEAKIASLMQRLSQLEAENAELKARLGLNSQNSSKPPSSDPPGGSSFVEPARHRLRGGGP